MLDSIDDVLRAFDENDYVADRSLATAVFLALRMRKPLLLEGEAGVGKTEVAKVLASVLSTPLLRLQCYEGIDVAAALYEWNYARQILAIRSYEGHGAAMDVFSREFLIRRPVLQALEYCGPRPAVLLLDEIDRSDDEFEAFLLEVLSDFQISIPEIGTIQSTNPPVVIITSNRTRELHEALKRRCLYHWIRYPDLDKEYAILSRKVPFATETLRHQVAAFAQSLRKRDLYKPPGVSETLDWANALTSLGTSELNESAVADTWGVILKNQEDIESLDKEPLTELVESARMSY